MTPETIYRLLYERYGDLDWWPAKTPYEVMAGAVLTQNTAWGNVEKAIARFGGTLTPERVEAMPIGELTETIRPAGFYNQKAGYLKTLTAWFKQYGYATEHARERGLASLRGELVALRGIGEETADSILLYALELPTFVVDAYTKRLLTRLGCGPRPPLAYNAVKAWFEDGLPPETALYNNLHAMIVINAKEHCRAKPLCEDCPLAAVCDSDLH